MQATPDFSKMSDADLEKYISSSSPTAQQPTTSGSPDFSSMSDDELEKFIAGSSAPARKTPEQNQEEINRYAQMPWMDVLKEGASNLPSSFGHTLKDVGSAIYNYEDTLGALGQMGKGLYSKAAGAIGVKQDPAEKEQNERLINALGQHYAEQYGTMGGFKRALATDPFSVGMDVSVPLSLGAGAGAKAAGLTGQVARLAGRAATVMDPVQSALAVAKMPLKLAATAGEAAQSGLSGVSRANLQTIRDIASAGSPSSREAFWKFARGNAEYSEIPSKALDAVEELREAENTKYLRDMAEAGRAPTQLSMDDIVQLDNSGQRLIAGSLQQPMTKQQIAQLNSILKNHIVGGSVKELNDFISLYGTNTRFSSARDMVNDINEQIFEALRNQNPMARTVIDLDNLKQSIGDILYSVDGTRFGGKVGKVYNSIRDTIASHAPVYGSAMENWQKWRRLSKDLKQSLSLNDKAATATTVAKMQKAQSEGGVRGGLLRALANTEAGKDIPAMLAGMSVNPWWAQGVRGQFEYPGFLLAAFAHPSLVPPAIGGALVSSPRLAGIEHYGVGMMSKPVGAVTGAATSRPVGLGLYGAGEAQQGQEQSTGGRIERREGGRVGIDHKAHAATLVRAAEAAKKQESRKTEPLLEAPDEHIVKALSLANEAI